MKTSQVSRANGATHTHQSPVSVLKEGVYFSISMYEHHYDRSTQTVLLAREQQQEVCQMYFF